MDSGRSSTFLISEKQDIISRPRLIEMVGIGGAGKSTLYRALHAENPSILKLDPPGKLHYLPTLAKMALHWLPVFVSKYGGSRWFTWDEMRNVCYLDTRLRQIRSLSGSTDTVAVLDPGSVYWLSSLREFGPPFTRDALFTAWWDEKLAEWSAAIDLLIWIEAPSDLLLERVLARDEVHEARSQPRESALANFERYRACYATMVPEVTSRGHARVFHFWSDHSTTDQMLHAILSKVDLRPN